MTDDIVTRLKQDAERCFITEVVRNYADAIAEIERLRKLTSELAQMMMPYALLMTKAEQEQVLKAVQSGL